MSTKLLAIVREQREAADKEIETLNKERLVRQTEADALIEHAETEKRDLDAKEAARFREVNAQIREIDAQLDSDDEEHLGATQRRDRLAERESELREHLESAEKAKENARAWADRSPDAGTVQRGGARVRSEPRTYTPEAQRQGVSFYRDVFNRQWNSDTKAADRLDRHQREVALHELAGYEQRVGTTGNYSGLVVPQYLTDMVAPLARALAPTVAICNRHDLPDNGNTIELSRITTGSSVGAQSTEGADSASSVDVDDTLLEVKVRTYDGMQDVSRQSLERGTLVESIVTQDLGRAYWTKVDSDILNGAGTNGTHLGIRSTGSIQSVAYASATPAVGELYPKLADLIQRVQSGAFMGVSHFIMAPRRWWWIASQLSDKKPLVHIPGVATEQAGNLGATDYAAVDRDILGVPVVLDGNIPTTLGTSTNEDVIIGVTADELHFWHDNGPMFLRAEQTLVDKLNVRFVLYSYSAFTAGRYPGAHGTVSSSGLATPSF